MNRQNRRKYFKYMKYLIDKSRTVQCEDRKKKDADADYFSLFFTLCKMITLTSTKNIKIESFL